MKIKTDNQIFILKVKEALPKDVGRTIARIDPEDMKDLGLDAGDIIEIKGKRKTPAKIMPCYAEDRGKKIIQMDGISRENAQIGLDEKVKINKVDSRPANKITLSPLTTSSLFTPLDKSLSNGARGDGDAKYLGSLIEGLPVISGDRVRATFFGSRSCDFKVVNTIPDGVVLINAATLIRMETKGQGEAKQTKVSYEDIGGLGTQIQRIREMVELPLRFPEVFERLGIQPPKGVFFYGPPGCGKTLIARAVANETDAYFISMSGPECMGKFYGEAEQRLRSLFEDAQAHAPAIIFIDEIESIAPKREDMGAEKQVERRVVAQLLCVEPNTPIYTPQGIFTIEDLYEKFKGDIKKEGEVEFTVPKNLCVFGYNGREIIETNVKYMSKLFVPSTRIVEFEKRGNITVSEIQRFMTVKDGKRVWVPISQLNAGDLIAIPSTLPTGNKEIVFDLFKLNGKVYALKLSGELERYFGSKYIKLEQLQVLYASGEIKDLGLVRFKLIASFHKLKRANLKELMKEIGLEETKPNKDKLRRILRDLLRRGAIDIQRERGERIFIANTEKPSLEKALQFIVGIARNKRSGLFPIKEIYFVKPVLSLNSDLAELLAYILADGSLNERRVNVSGKSRIVDRTAILIESLFHFTPRRSIRNGVSRIDAWSFTLANLMQDLYGLPAGKKSYIVNVPEYLYAAKKETIATFLRSYFDCDGSIKETNIQAFSRSKAMMIGLSRLLMRFSIPTTITYTNNMWFCHVVGGYQSYGKFSQSIGTARDERREQINNLLNRKRKLNREVVPCMVNTLYSLQKKYRVKIADNDYRYLTGTSNLTGDKLDYFVNLFESYMPEEKEFLELKAVNESELNWVRIEKISPAQPMVMYDLTTRTENFIGGELPILLHNSLMDGLESRGQVIVMAATNVPNLIDPALRRPGRFDREMSIPIPDKNGRLEILQIHTRGMPLAEDVSIEKLAEITHGYVGADLEALAREAAMSALRKILPKIDFEMAEIPYETLMKLEVGMNNFLEAMKEIEPSAIREVFVEVPDVRWSDVGGLEDIKKRLMETVEWPLKYSELFKKADTNPPKGILLYGPPGTGKTLLAKAVASESGVNFISIKGPQLVSKYVGESEKGIREIFRKAKQASPCILFFDEMDAIVPLRSGGDSSHVSERVISQFLTEMDGIEELKGVLILGATNRLDLVDKAVLRPGRFDLLLELPLPDEKTRLEIYKIHTKGKPLDSDVDLKELVDETDRFTGADIESIVRSASILSMRDFLEKEKGKISEEKLKGFTIKKRFFDEAVKIIKKREA